MVGKRNNRYFVTDLRKDFAAELCGLKVGMEIIRFNGRPVEEQMMSFLPKYTKQHDDSMLEYSLAMLFAGTHDQPRVIMVLENGREKSFYPDKHRPQTKQNKLLEHRLLNDQTGYIKINNSLGETDLIPQFDSVLNSLMNTKGLILDLTETPGGGNSTVARAIMGRFIEKDMPYQKHEFDDGKYRIRRSWIEYVSPRKGIYKNELVVMVGHWTGSMGEGIAIGFDGMKKGRVVGTRMAGLLGAINGFRTTETNIAFQIPTERLYHINGTPREDFFPGTLTGNIYETWELVNKIVNKD